MKLSDSILSLQYEGLLHLIAEETNQAFGEAVFRYKVYAENIVFIMHCTCEFFTIFKQ